MTKLYEQVRSGTLSLREASRLSETPYTTLHARYNKWLAETLAVEAGNSALVEARHIHSTGIRSSKLCVESPAMPLKAPINASGDEWTLPGKMPVKIPQIIQSKQAPARGGTFKRFVIGFDVHGDKQHVPTNEAFFKFIDNWQPDIRIMGGDLWDFRPLRKKATREERQESMRQDYEAGLGWLLRFGPNYFLRGNHDERLWDLARDGCGVEGDFAREKVDSIEARLAQMNVTMLPYDIEDGILQLGHLKVAHGFFNGVNCAKQMAEVYGSVVFGHNHVIQVQPIPGIERRAARCGGALCILKQNYNRRQPSALRHANGWPYGVISEVTGNYHIFQAEQIDGMWVLPSDVVEMR